MFFDTLYLILPGVLACFVAGGIIWRKQSHSDEYVQLKTLHHPGIEDLVNGPKPSSWLAGNLADLIGASNIGDKDQEYVEQHGIAFKFMGSFGRPNVLYLADPKALNFVLNTSGYIFNRGKQVEAGRLLFGSSLLTSTSQEHARQRKILLPAFSQPVIRDIFPAFMEVSEQLATKWIDLYQSAGEAPCVVNVHDWFSRLTLDGVGKGTFSYDFGALGDTPSEYLQVFNALFAATQSKPPKMRNVAIGLAAIDLLQYLPLWFLRPIGKLLMRSPLIKKFKGNAEKMALEHIENEKRAAAGQVPKGKDIMSTLVRSNLSEDAQRKLTDEELMGQLIVFTVAAHQTTSTTLSWIFYELARHPEFQEKLRNEIKLFRNALGDKKPAASDLESQLPHTTAAIKETLRFHPPAAHILRWASKDGTIPLSEPIKMRNGELTKHVSLKAGQSVIISVTAYNRLKNLWGDDANVWNPDRFLGERLNDLPKNTLGVYANLSTFSSGVHSCIGWRFAILQLHVIVISLLEKFTFSPSPKSEIYKAPFTGLLPFVKGQEKEGPQLPLAIVPV
ncbi:hypothetical protein M422DRAFT_36040 [Sphaerobolus stellatus SS14]|uniref:Cytochrome P450 n=1 Tax=Sphaerobolus stellatus (strain SS14) TaxID=990650 RepID=A0A0C9V3A1_SPHS4|nr:hypothetical protein M422DRAFT_36040 [Sphaerobolus stellatus SS14]